MGLPPHHSQGRSDLAGPARLQSLREHIPCFSLYKLGKWLFPKNPRMVRYRKLRILFFAIAFCIAGCLFIGLMIYLLYRAGRK